MRRVLMPAIRLRVANEESAVARSLNRVHTRARERRQKLIRILPVLKGRVSEENGAVPEQPVAPVAWNTHEYTKWGLANVQCCHISAIKKTHK